MKIEQFLVGEMANFTYLLIDEINNSCIIVDPSWDLDTIFEYIKKNNLQIKFIINTHSHFDHTLGNEQVVQVTGAKIMQHRNSPLHKDKILEDGDRIEFGSSIIDVIYTPGHTKDSICLIVDNEIILTGDTIFVGSCGRLDLPGGSASEMFDSIYGKLSNLDEKLIVYPGHHYGSKKTSSMRDEKQNNFVFKFRSKEEFLSFMNT
ncbi:MBL fold metallo-hydrolase [Candidatus Nitrosocosmicus franklandus]|uniref:Putative polyketide biosynthesis zinc-dependent hydrolase PksB n=1 Tax=Candidatus Nitrosocosmicus franklandianus TaxID=1798806 RepID=A0A484IDC4_9ARCH|nr:MBL fold metallo-hydrolase [Candidatus Nitrosocosmicus franklandus]VFJ15101.1 putative polyketide biosynthesis zinc-dependent hydrolase PksB [Candidatus Nitrosocosmicus franklandus]